MDQDFIAIVGLGVAMLALMWNTRSETFRRFAEMKQDTDARFTEMKQNTDARFAEMKQNTDARFAEMKQNTDARFAEMKQNTDARFDALERKTDAIATVVHGLAERTARIEGVLLGPSRPTRNGERGPRWAWSPVEEEEDRPATTEDV